MNAWLGNFQIDVDRALLDLEQGWGMPTSWYHDRYVYEFELDTIWNREWQYVGPRSKLSRPGDMLTAELGRVPVVVVCGEDGTLKGFVNVCRHRGHPVVREDGNGRAMVCPYHGWTYRLDGSLKRAPESDGEPGFDLGQLGLMEVSVDSWGHAVFANPDPDAPAFRDAHPRFDEVTQSRGLTPDLGAYLFKRRIEYDANANWKLWYDNNVECYHCSRIHGASFSAAYNVAPGQFKSFELDRLMSYSFQAMEDDHDDALRSSNYRSMQLFPGITMIQQDDMMVLSQMLPRGPDRTVSVMDYFIESGADDDRFNRWVGLWHQTFSEDLTAAANQHRGMCSGRLEKSRFVTTRERPMVFINRVILNAYQAGLNRGAAPLMR